MTTLLLKAKHFFLHLKKALHSLDNLVKMSLVHTNQKKTNEQQWYGWRFEEYTLEKCKS